MTGVGRFIGDFRITIPFTVFVSIITALFVGQNLVIIWLDKVFVSEDQFRVFEVKMERAVTLSNETSIELSEFMVRQELRDVVRAMETARDQYDDLILWETLNGENQQSRLRKVELRKRINRAEEKLQCIRQQHRNCDV